MKMKTKKQVLLQKLKKINKIYLPEIKIILSINTQLLKSSRQIIIWGQKNNNNNS